MKKFLISCLLGYPLISYAIESKIQHLLQTTDSSFSIGIEVQDIKGQVIFSRNAQQSFVTASTQKILPAALALAASKDPGLIPHLSSSFGKTPFVTEIVYDPKNNATYLVFGGDPLLNLKDLNHIFQEAKTKGLIGKTLYVVMTRPEDLPPTSPGCPHEGIEFCYGGIVSSAVINQNRVSFDLSGKSKTDQARITLDEGQPAFPVENKTHTADICFVDPIVGQWDQVQRSALYFDGKKITVTGCVTTLFEAKMCLPVLPHAMEPYIRAFLVEALKRHHVTANIVFRDKLPSGKGLKKFSYSSSKLEKLLNLCLKDSNNLVTDALFGKLTQNPSWPRNWDFAGRALKGHMEKVFGVTFSPEDDLQSGSGLSFYNRLTPSTLSQILRKIYAKLGQGFLDCLSQAGVDGTLSSRLKDLPPCSKILGKTGQMRGITNFGGYLQKNGQSPYIVTIFITGHREKEKERKSLMDNILLAILEDL